MFNTAIKWTGLILSFFVAYWSMTLLVNAGDATTIIPKGMETALTNFYKEYYVFVNGFIAFGMLTGVLAFIVLFVQLAQVGNNPYMRLFILREMLAVGISTALLGGFPLMIILYYAMFS